MEAVDKLSPLLSYVAVITPTTRSVIVLISAEPTPSCFPTRDVMGNNSGPGTDWV